MLRALHPVSAQDNFFLSRIALRFLAGNHIALYEQTQLPEDQRHADRIGLIHTKCKPYEVSAVYSAVGSPRCSLLFLCTPHGVSCWYTCCPRIHMLSMHPVCASYEMLNVRISVRVCCSMLPFSVVCCLTLCVCVCVCVTQVVEDAVERAREVCAHVRGDAPSVIIRGSRHLTLP